jgi:small subunit ribosomal protein S6
LAQNVYECMFILDSNRYAKDANGVSSEIPAMVEKMGGEIMVSRLWNEQKLAYPINGQRKGTYWLTYFRMESTRLSQFNRECQLNGNILRHLTLLVDPRLVEVLVAHARGERLAREEPVAAAVEAAVGEEVGEEAGEPEAGEPDEVEKE